MIERDVVRVEGPDALSFLQGQVSQDVAEMAVGDDALAFILQPQGKVDALVRVTRLAEDAFELDVDSGFGQAVADRLTRFKIRVKCDVTLAGSRSMPEPWGEGADRIDAAWPAMGKELDEKTIPAETGLVERAVSFTKGCFTGQELVARIDSRGGNVARHLRHVELDLPAGVDAPEGASVEVGGKERGRLTSVNGSTALAYVHRDVAPPADATVRWEGGQAPARILP